MRIDVTANVCVAETSHRVLAADHGGEEFRVLVCERIEAPTLRPLNVAG